DGLQHRVEVAVERAAAIGYPPQHARALTQLARLAYNGQQYATAQRVARSAYEISASSDHARIAAGSAWLVAAAALGSRELETAAEFSEIAIGLSRHVDAVLLARAESLRAAVYRTSGDFEGARALGESAVARLERSQAAGSLRMAESYTALAATLGEMGELDEATHYATAAREIFASVEGERSRGALNVRNELAILRGLSGDHEGATELHKEVLEARIDALGAQDPDVAQSWINLAGSQYAAGQHEQAASTGLVGAELQAELRGADHPLTAAAYFNVAAVLLQLDRFVEAEVLLRRSHEAIIARLGADHPDTILSGCGLSFALLALGRDEAAAQVTGRAAAVAERHLDAQAAGTALYDRARLRLVAGDYVGVLDDARRIREILAAQRPEDASLRSQAQRWFEMNGIVI
ncbi:MAG: tetratricopeptide repeat protein, partial [Nannocystaceae bacterium]|nr:tetratricopeptide repeat protein [Nannocystaceae bacterium]